jgi:hypothetical protein
MPQPATMPLKAFDGFRFHATPLLPYFLFSRHIFFAFISFSRRHYAAATLSSICRFRFSFFFAIFRFQFSAARHFHISFRLFRRFFRRFVAATPFHVSMPLFASC